MKRRKKGEGKKGGGEKKEGKLRKKRKEKSACAHSANKIYVHPLLYTVKNGVCR